MLKAQPRSAILALFAALCFVALIGSVAGADAPQGGEPQLINIDVKEAPVEQVLRMLAKAADVNIIVGQDVKGTVQSVTLKDVTVDTALRMIARSLGFFWYKEDNVYFVSTQPPAAPAVASSTTGTAGGGQPVAAAGGTVTTGDGQPAATTPRTTPLQPLAAAPPPLAPSTAPPADVPTAEPKIVSALIPLKYVDAAEMAILFGGVVSDGGTPGTRMPGATRGELRRNAGRSGRTVQSDVFGLNFGMPGGSNSGLSQDFGGGNTGGRGSRGSRGSSDTGTGGGTSGTSSRRGGTGSTGGSGGGLGTMLPGDMEPPLAFLPQNALLVQGTQEDIDRFREILDLLDKPARQVEISTKFVNVQTTAAQALGIDWAISNGSLEFFNQGFAPAEAVNNVVRFSHGRLTAQLNTLLSSGRATVINEPHVITANNQYAEIEFTTTIPYFSATVSYNQFGTREVDFTSEEVDVTNSLFVVPRINVDDSVTVYLEPLLEDNIGEVEGPNGERIPIVTSQFVSTTVRVGDGETIVMGGLIRKNESSTLRETPLLGRIPIIGPLFQAKRLTKDNSELLIFVTPHIIRDVPKQ
jgi:type II secretory pathway component GspD/PulD (secretin)